MECKLGSRSADRLYEISRAEAYEDSGDRKYAEMDFANAPLRTLTSVMRGVLPAVVMKEPELFQNLPDPIRNLLNDMFVHPTTDTHSAVPDLAPNSEMAAKYASDYNLSNFNDEEWFYVNGINIDDPSADLNAQMLADVFGREVTVLHNPTDGFLSDVADCGLGKQYNEDIDQTSLIFDNIKAALQDPTKDKVVVMAHSGGTIQTSVALQQLANDVGTENGLTTDELQKLEIYNFANCADDYHVENLPEGIHMENFANEKDPVAWLGNLSTDPENHGIDIPGTTYINEGKWGHLFNMYYAEELNDYNPQTGENMHYTAHKLDDTGNWVEDPNAPSSRLYSYMFGHSSEAVA